MNIDELVLTDQEITKIIKEALSPECRRIPIGMFDAITSSAKAQLKKAEPLIRKDEREKLLKEIARRVERRPDLYVFPAFMEIIKALKATKGKEG